MSSGSPSPAPQRGFSLIEVTLALGIVSFAMVTLLALIPVGLNSFKKAMSLTVEAQIVQSISSEIALQTSNLQGASYYFDIQGTPTTASGADKVYTATLSFQKGLANVAAASLDSGAGTQATIDIQSTVTPNQLRHYTIIVASNGQ